MSMNIMIEACRDVEFRRYDGTVGHDVQRQAFGAWRTPTDITHQITNSPDPAKAYIDWVASQRQVVKVDIYADDDLFEEREPVDWYEYCPEADHIKYFLEWLEQMKNGGFTVKYSMV